MTMIFLSRVTGMPQCWIQLPAQWHWQVYMVVVALTVLIIPCILISGCYIIIVYTIWSKSSHAALGGVHRPLGAAAIVTAATPQSCHSESCHCESAIVTEATPQSCHSESCHCESAIVTADPTVQPQ